MRASGLGALFAGTNLVDGQQLAGGAEFGGSGQELRALAQFLDIADRGMGSRVAGQVIQIVAEIDGGFVAGVDDLTEGDARPLGHAEDGGAHVSALREQRGVARRLAGLERLAEGGEDAIAEVGGAHAIGAGHHHARGAGKGGKRVLPGGTFGLVRLGIAGCVDESRRNAERMAALEHGQGGLGRDGQDDQIDLLGHAFDIGIGRQALHGGVLRIDRIDLREARADQQVDGDSADAGLVIRSANNRDCARPEQGLQIHAASSFKGWGRNRYSSVLNVTVRLR